MDNDEYGGSLGDMSKIGIYGAFATSLHDEWLETMRERRGSYVHPPKKRKPSKVRNKRKATKNARRKNRRK